MYRYYLALLFTFFVNTAHAEMVENKEALNVIYATKIAGIGFNSSVEDIKKSILQHKMPMECHYSENVRSAGTKLGKKTKKDVLYQNWRCKYIDGMKHKMLDVQTANGTVLLISYRGSIASSLDDKDMFSYYRDIDRKLSVAGLVHDDRNFVFKDIGLDISPTYAQQTLTAKLLTECNGGDSSVVFEGKLTDMPTQKAFTIEVTYKRQNCD